ncbi:MAG: hypothetical protein AAF840_11035, partial [Bacteroidota bacterium]
RFLNKTTISVDRQHLNLAHGPIPWPFSKDHRIPAKALEQLYVNLSSVKVNNQPTYNLIAKLDTGVEIKLIRAEQDKQLALDLERTIEAYLDIKNDTSFDLGNTKLDKLDLQQMKEQLEQMKKLKKWLPGSIVKQMELAEQKIEQQAQEASSSSTPYAPASAPGSTSTEAFRDEDFFRRTAPGGPRPLPEPTHDFTYPLYHAQGGEVFTYRNQTYRLGRSAQIDWEDTNITTGRQLEAIGNDDRTHFYAQNERDRWAYFEERRLDDNEVAALGFNSDDHPLRFENGDERYYPRDEQKGTRYMGSYSHTVRQFIYFTTASGTQFRALKPEGGSWELYIMEVVDGSSFEQG